jgi:hypothetical protein
VGRVVGLVVLASVLCLAVGTAAASAQSRAGSGPFAQFRACLKENGAPAPIRLPRGTKPSADQIAAWKAAWKKAFTACRQLLPARPAKPASPKPKPGGWPHIARPTTAQLTAFKGCMATHGFTAGTPGTIPFPNLRDPAVRTALKTALTACWPLLKPKPSS